MMDLVAGVGGMMGQLAVGIAGSIDSQGDQSAVMNIATKMQSLQKTKSSTVDSLPDKVTIFGWFKSPFHKYNIY